MTPLRTFSTLAALLLALLPAAAQEDDIRVGNRIVAIAEGEIVTGVELQRELEPILPRLQIEARGEEDFRRRVREIQREILQNLVDRIIIVKEAEEKGLQIPSSFIDQEYNEVINRDFGGDRSRFLTFLRENNKTPRSYREDLRNRIIVRVMQQENRRSQSEVSPERIDEFYTSNKLRFYQHEAVHLRQIILTPLADEGTALLEQTARQIIRELEDGADFGDLARRYSQDDMSRRGGDWGWIKREDIRRELASVAFELEPGGHSEPVQLDGNIFILYIEDKREEMIQPVTQVRELIEQFLAGEIARESQERWIQRLREKAYIKYFL